MSTRRRNSWLPQLSKQRKASVKKEMVSAPSVFLAPTCQTPSPPLETLTLSPFTAFGGSFLSFFDEEAIKSVALEAPAVDSSSTIPRSLPPSPPLISAPPSPTPFDSTPLPSPAPTFGSSFSETSTTSSTASSTSTSRSVGTTCAAMSPPRTPSTFRYKIRRKPVPTILNLEVLGALRGNTTEELLSDDSTGVLRAALAVGEDSDEPSSNESRSDLSASSASSLRSDSSDPSSVATSCHHSPKPSFEPPEIQVKACEDDWSYVRRQNSFSGASTSSSTNSSLVFSPTRVQMGDRAIYVMPKLGNSSSESLPPAGKSLAHEEQSDVPDIRLMGKC